MTEKAEMGFVLTADVAGSTETDAVQLQQTFERIAGEIEKMLSVQTEFFRGDSFQSLLPDAAEALRIALLWRAGLKWLLPGSDVRCAFGAGAVVHRSETLAHSAGPAFERSGTLLDSMTPADEARIAFSTGDAVLDAELETACLLAEPSIRRWTSAGAEAVYLQLLYGETQQVLAGRIGVAQPAVHKRLQAASWPAIRHWERYYRNAVASRIQALSA